MQICQEKREHGQEKQPVRVEAGALGLNGEFCVVVDSSIISCLLKQAQGSMGEETQSVCILLQHLSVTRVPTETLENEEVVKSPHSLVCCYRVISPKFLFN